MLQRLRQEESGAALVLALAFLALFGLWMAAILGFTDANIRATRKLREQRAVATSATGATDAAIQFVRGSATAGWPGQTCPTYTASVNGESVSVACTSQTAGTHTDRTVAFTATISGTNRVEATVIYRDSAVSGGAAPAVDVIRWRYNR